MRPTPVLVIALLLTLTASRGRAEEGDTTPQAAFEALVASLPAPGKKHAYTFEGEALMNGKPFGEVTFGAEPTEDGHWSVTDSFSFAGGSYVRTATALLDARFQPLSGRVEGKEPGTDGFEIVWTRTDAGFAVKHTVTRGGETSTAEKTIEHTGTVTTTMAALWLFARMVHPGEGTYAVMVFDADPGPGSQALETSTWTFGAKGTWGTQEALLLKGAKGANQFEAGLARSDGALLGSRMKNPAAGVDMEIRPAGTGTAGEAEDDLFARPAKTAEEAALQAGLGFATGDLELLGRVIHWPTLHARAQAQHEAETTGQPHAEPYPDVEAFKKATLEALAGSLPKMPRPMIEGMLKTMGPQLKSESTDDGLTKITFPPMFRSMVVVVGEIDGAWYLVRMPGKPE